MQRERLKELAVLFLRLGATAFGGPAAHVALMQQEIVARLGWLTKEEFLDLYGAAQLIPGPNSTEVAIHVGYRRAGLAGLIVAGACFILPAALMVSGISAAYVAWGSLPQMTAVLYGVKPVMIAIVAKAFFDLAPTAGKSLLLQTIGILAMTASFMRIDLLFILGTGALIPALLAARRRPLAAVATPTPILRAAPAAASVATATISVGLTPLFLVFLKIGAVLFGSGYVLLAFLRADLVERHHWLTESQLLDAVAVGQVTPGPVFTAATFIGWILHGPTGAAVATLGIFLPAFLMVALSGPLIPRIRASKVAGAALDGVNVASLGLLAAVTFELGRSSLVDVPTAAIAGLSFLALYRFKRINSALWVAVGALLGLLAARLSPR